MVNETNTNSLSTNKYDYFNEFFKGIFKENPIFILIIGICPSLAITYSITNGIAYGLSVLIILVLSNFLISILKNIIQENFKFLSYLIITSTLVVLLNLALKAFFPLISSSLGIYLPLISINCLIISRGIYFASKNTFGKTLLDSLGMGIGFLLSIVFISTIRELLGTCNMNLTDLGINFTLFNNEGKIILDLFDKKYEIFSGINIFLLPAGAFFIIGISLALINIKNKRKFIKDKK